MFCDLANVVGLSFDVQGRTAPFSSRTWGPLPEGWVTGEAFRGDRGKGYTVGVRVKLIKGYLYEIVVMLIFRVVI